MHPLNLLRILLLFTLSCSMATALTALYVGSFSGEEVLVYYVDKSNLLLTQSIVAGYTPTWFAYSNNVLYSTNEQAGFIASLDSAASGALTYVDRVSSSGTSPTYITISPDGNYVLAANYDSGSDVVIGINARGIFGKTTDFQQHNGTGPVPGRQTGPHAHQIIFDNSGKFVYSADLGADKIYQYRWNNALGKLAPLDVPYVSSDPGDGPRHLVFHQNGEWAYLSCELSSSVIAFKLDPTGQLKRFQKLLTVPKPYDANNYPAEPIVHPNGLFLFVSNRGNDSISVFHINQTDGTLTPTSIHPVNGAYPRGMVLDTTNNIIFTMNQNSGTITSLSVNPANGELTFLGISASGLATPVCGYLLPLK